jgi:hypothetical protein
LIPLCQAQAFGNPVLIGVIRPGEMLHHHFLDRSGHLLEASNDVCDQSLLFEREHLSNTYMKKMGIFAQPMRWKYGLAVGWLKHAYQWHDMGYWRVLLLSRKRLRSVVQRSGSAGGGTPPAEPVVR